MTTFHESHSAPAPEHLWYYPYINGEPMSNFLEGGKWEYGERGLQVAGTQEVLDQGIEDLLGEWRIKAYPKSLYGVYKAQFDTYIVVMPVKENNVLILKAGERLANGEINDD